MPKTKHLIKLSLLKLIFTSISLSLKKFCKIVQSFIPCCLFDYIWLQRERESFFSHEKWHKRDMQFKLNLSYYIVYSLWKWNLTYSLVEWNKEKQKDESSKVRVCAKIDWTQEKTNIIFNFNLWISMKCVTESYLMWIYVWQSNVWQNLTGEKVKHFYNRSFVQNSNRRLFNACKST